KQDLLIHGLCQEIELKLLSESDVADYLLREFQGPDFPEGLAGLIHEHSAGNPLFMTAIVKDLINKGLMAQQRGRWRLTKPLREVDPGVPETLLRMLELQFDRLNQTEKSILKSASVCGDSFSIWSIGSSLDIPAGRIEDSCEDLAAKEQFIRSAGVQEID